MHQQICTCNHHKLLEVATQSHVREQTSTSGPKWLLNPLALATGNEPAAAFRGFCWKSQNHQKKSHQPFGAHPGAHEIIKRTCQSFRALVGTHEIIEEILQPFRTHHLPALRGSIWKSRGRPIFLSAMRCSLHSQNPLNTRMKHSRSFTRIKKLLGLRSRN